MTLRKAAEQLLIACLEKARKVALPDSAFFSAGWGPWAYGSGKFRGAERNLPDFCILPDQSNSLLNLGNFWKAKNVSPHCPIFLHFLILSYIFLVFQFIFPTFPQLTFKICPTYRHFSFSWGGGGSHVYGNMRSTYSMHGRLFPGADNLLFKRYFNF